MSADYVAFLGNGTAPTPRTLARLGELGLNPVIETETAKVFAGKKRSVVEFVDGRGVLLGQLFRRGGDGSQLSCIPPNCADRLRNDRGRHLIRDYWGSYVLIVQASPTQGIILRDPSAAVPAYYVATGSQYVVSSDAMLLCDCSEQTGSIGWCNVAWHLMNSTLGHSRTCVEEIYELPRGHSLTFGSDSNGLARHWSPWDFARDTASSDAATAAEELRDVVGTSIRALAGAHRHILVPMSGGLDSSIIACCLADGSARVTGLTMASNDGVGDERAYARQVSDALRVSLREHSYDLALINIRRSNSASQPRPAGRYLAQAFGNVVRDHVTESGIDAVFTGGGGDNVFCAMYSALPLADRLHGKNVGFSTLRTLEDVCRLGRGTYLEAINDAVRVLARPHRRSGKPDRRFLSKEAESYASEHPWTDNSEDVAPGKQEHVRMIAGIHNFTESGLADCGVPVVSPLLSQPVIEKCLQIPTWLWCAGGRDRAIARRAFAPRLPTPILQRIGKGGPDYTDADVVLRNRSAMAELLLEGLLVKHGVVDRTAVASFLDRADGDLSADHVRLLAIADAEAWARAWNDRH